MHVLEAGYEPGRPCVLLLHGFPELAYSWRKVMLPLAAAGYHVIAPDQRGYGRTTGWDADYDGDLAPVPHAQPGARRAGAASPRSGIGSVAAVIGHDFGSPVAAWCALARPDVFRSVALMSAPFGGPPRSAAGRAASAIGADIHDDAGGAALGRASTTSGTTRRARPNDNMWHAPQGLHAFLRAYYHYKSADWPGNKPHPLAALDARTSWPKLPTLLRHGPRQGHGRDGGARHAVAERDRRLPWLTDAELAVYAAEYARTGFQGGLSGIAAARSGRVSTRSCALFAGRTIDVPVVFIAGASDWGIYQTPGRASSACSDEACTRHARRAPGRRRRPLGAAGAAGAGQRAAAGVPAGFLSCGPADRLRATPAGIPETC